MQLLFLLLLLVVPFLVLTLVNRKAGNGVEGDEPAMLVQPRAGRSTQMRVSLVVAGVDVDEDDAGNLPRLPAVAHNAARLSTIVLVRPDIGPAGRPVDFEAAARLKRDVDFRIAIPQTHTIRFKFHAPPEAMRSLTELLRLAIPDTPVLLLQRPNARARRTER